MNLTFVLELNQEKNYENLSQSVIDIFNIFINEVPNCPLEVFFSCMPPKFLICLFLWEFFLTVYKNKYKFIILIHIMKIKPFNNLHTNSYNTGAPYKLRKKARGSPFQRENKPIIGIPFNG